MVEIFKVQHTIYCWFQKVQKYIEEEDLIKFAKELEQKTLKEFEAFHADNLLPYRKKVRDQLKKNLNSKQYHAINMNQQNQVRKKGLFLQVHK